MGNFILVIASILAIWGVKSCSDYTKTPEYQAQRKAERKRCETPRLVSEIDGVKLYAIYLDGPDYSCGQLPVYFSRSGTQTEHTEHHGKSSTTVIDRVSGADVTPGKE